MHDVFVLNSDGGSMPMQRVRCVSEDLELQRVLEKNHNLLPGDQIDPKDPRRWLLIKREMPVPDPGTATDRWNLDFLFADQDAIPTLVECKRFSSTESRRQVVGQLIEYAANGHHYWSKNLLRRLAEESAKDKGQTLEDVLHELRGPSDESPDDFFNLLESNLRDGRLRIVFFLDESPVELRSVVDFLSKHLLQETEVFLVEARQYRSEDTLVVVPTLFGFTEAVRKDIQSIASQKIPSGKKWDEDSFFADAQSKLAENAKPVRQLYDDLRELRFDITWGRGQKMGSFNPKSEAICPRSIITVFSTGALQLNLDWLPEVCRLKLRELAENEMGLKVQSIQKFPLYSAEDWINKESILAEGLQRIVEHFLAAADDSKLDNETALLTTS